MSLYKDVLATGGYISNHESDLYIEVNDVNKALLERYQIKAQVFTNQVTGKLCYDVPFMYEPWWEDRMKKGCLTNLEADMAEGKYDNWQEKPKPPLGKLKPE